MHGQSKGRLFRWWHWALSRVRPSASGSARPAAPRARPRFEPLEDRALPAGGVSTAVADTNADGYADLITVPDAGTPALVRVLSGKDGTELRAWLPFLASFLGGASVAAADVNGDRAADVVVGGNGLPAVLIFDGQSGAQLRTLAFPAGFLGAVSVAAVDVNGDGFAEVIASGGPAVTIFDGRTGAEQSTSLPLGLGFGSVSVATGDIDGDGTADVLAGVGTALGPIVRAFDGTDGRELALYFTAAPGFAGGVSITAADVTGDGVSDVLTGARAGGSLVLAFDGRTATPVRATFAFGSLPIGTRLSAADLNGDGTADLVAGTGDGGNWGVRLLSGVGPSDLGGLFAYGPFGVVGSFRSLAAVPPTASTPDAPLGAESFLRWNDALLAAVRVTASAPPVASRAMAILNVALDDVLAGFDGRAGYLVTQAPAAGADRRAAVAAAGHRILTALYPTRATVLDAELASALATVPDGPAEVTGRAHGRAVADAVLAQRANDGSGTAGTFTPSGAVGAWEPTPPAFAPASLPQWAAVTPFALDRPAQFRPPAPPALDSDAWRTDLAEVRALGQNTSAARTADQTKVAQFWADGAGTSTPPGHWLEIAAAAARAENLDAVTTSRMMATVSVALADAGVAAWDAKYAYATWRPITAIREADVLNGPSVVADPTWTPLLTTPNHPEYVSGHSTFSRAAATVLDAFVGPEYAFSTSGLVGGATVTRSFANFGAAADEAGRSRIYGGIHFEFSNRAGQDLGRAVAQQALSRFGQTEPVTVTALSPADGAEMVSPTRETTVRFSGEVDPTTVTGDAFYLFAGGTRVPGTIRVSATNRSATFFPTAPLPESTAVRVVVDGDRIIAVGGSAVDADGDGVAGGTATADFRTLPLTLIPNTRVFGYVFDSYNRNPDGSDIPVVGATISLDARPDVFAVTDARGFFELGVQDLNRDGIPDGLPAPEFFVHIDGGTAVNAPAGAKYARLGKPFHSVPGQRVQLRMDGSPGDADPAAPGVQFHVYLPPMAMADIVPLPPDRAVVVGFGPSVTAPGRMAELFPGLTPAELALLPEMQVTYPAGSARTADGTAATRATVIPVNPQRLPAPLPGGVDPKLVISVQAGTADGSGNPQFNVSGGDMNFDVPAPVRLPNLDGLLPGEKSLLWSFDHDAGMWTVTGTMTVTADGRAVVTDAGVGVLAPGWHFAAPGADGTANSTNAEDDADLTSPNSRWRRLLDESYPSPEVQEALERTGATLQPVGSAQGADGEPWGYFDEFRITIPADRLLTTRGETPAEYLARWAQDMNAVPEGGNRTLFRALADFPEFDAPPPVGTIIRADVRDPSGLVSFVSNDVMLTERTDDRFRFTTVTTDRAGRHVFNGSREFGLTRNGDGSVTFYTRSVDSVNASGLESVAYYAAQRAIWVSLLGGVGSAFALSPAEVDRRMSSEQHAIPTQPPPGVYTPPGGTLWPQSDTLQRTSPVAPAAPSQVFYRVQVARTASNSDVDTELSGRSRANGVIPLVLPAKSRFGIYTYNPVTQRLGVSSGVVDTGVGLDLGRISTWLPAGSDDDQDGLGALAEYVLGTAADRADSDGDGVLDGAEIDQGLNPLDGVGFPTGVIASLPLPGPAEAVAAANDRVYVATGAHGLVVVDGADFDNPVLLGQIDLNGTATDVSVDPARDLVAVATGLAVQVVDVSDPVRPTLARTVSVSASFVEVVDGFAFAAGGTTLAVIDLTSGDVVRRVTLPGTGSVTGLAREGARLYAFVSGSDTLSVIDVSTPEQPVILGQRVVSVASASVGLFVGNDTVYLAGSGVRALDASNPADLRLVGQPQVGADFFSARRLALNGSGLALVAPDGGNTLALYDAADRTRTGANRFLTAFTLSGPVKDVAISRGIGYAAAGGRLEVVNYRPFDAAGRPPTDLALTASVADLDPAASGTQVLEGTRIPLRLAVRDDVQVRQVEFLVNGRVVQTDVAFPFDPVIAAPAIAVGGTALRIQARVTDTGGNTALSNELVIDVGPDTFPPTVESMSPTEGALIREGLRTFRIRFNESVDAGRLIAPGAVRVVGAGVDDVFDTADDVAVPIAVEARDGDRLFQVSTGYLSPGRYQSRVSRAAVVDRAGNAAGTGDFVTGFTVGQTAARLIGNPPTVAFVIDISGSAAGGLGGTGIGDRNGDGAADTILDAEIAGFEVLNQELINLGFGSTARVAVIPFDSAATNRDMDPFAAGVQLVTSPLADANGDGVRDVEEVLRGLRVAGGTNFEAPYQRVVSTFASVGVPDGTGNVIFISDGDGGTGFADEVAALRTQGHGIVAFGAGSGARLDLLQQMDPQAARFSSTDQLLELFVEITAQ